MALRQWKEHVHVDGETFSEADIKKVGSALYIKHPSTIMLSLAFAPGKERVRLLRHGSDGLFNPNTKSGDRLRVLAADEDVQMVAHYAPFEQWFWEEIMVKVHGFAPIAVHRWKCTAAKCLRYGLPGSLEAAGKVLHLPIQKDDVGKKVMLKLSKPRRITKNNPDQRRWTPFTAPEEFKILYDYNITDVESERCLDEHLRDLTPKEQSLWCLDQRMNRQGVCVDRPAIEKAMIIIREEKGHLLTRFEEITGVTSPLKRAKFLEWLNETGVEVANTQAPTIRRLLANPEIRGVIKEALEITTQVTRTSLAKLPKMMMLSDEEGFMRDVLQYWGAFTGRWAGRGAQIHNLVRPNLDVDLCLWAIENLSYEQFRLFYPDVMEAISKALRGFIIPPPGCDFLVADYAQFENRVAAWLAGFEEKLDRFRTGEDLYCDIASEIFGFRVSKTENPDERNVGKLGELASQYRGGIAAQGRFSKVYDVNLEAVFPVLWKDATYKEKHSAKFCYKLYLNTDPEEPMTKKAAFAANVIKDRWREANQPIVDLWTDLEIAIARAVTAKKQGTKVPCGDRLTFFMDGIFLHAELPSGRTITYPYPKIRTGRRGKQEFSYYSADDRSRISSHGGKTLENLTQATQRDFLSDGIKRLEPIYPLSFHEHDEAIAPVPKGEGDLNEFMNILKKHPKWARDIPIDVEGWRGPRYGKH